MIDRRAFLVTLAAGAAGTAVGCARRTSGLAAAAPARRLAPGVQLYTVRAAMREDVERTLARVAQLGYREVEFAGYFGRTPAQVTAALAATGLTAPSTHVPLEAVQGERLARTLDEAAAIGHRWVVVPWLAPAQRRTLDDWKRVAAALNAAGRAAGERGLRVGYHNHDFELAPIEGRLPLDVLLAESDAALVSLQLDVFWAVKAGADPLALLDRHGPRVTMLHLKDSAGAPRHEQVDVGAGVINWRQVLDRAAHAQHAFAEHDDPKDPWASLEASRAGLRRVGVE